MSDKCAIAAILAACAHQRQIQCGPAQPSLPFDQCIGNALKDLGLADNFTIKTVGENRCDYEALVRTQPGARTIKLGDAGFGVSQVLPILVQAFYCPPHSTLWIEQPEIHLHAQVQAELADVLISAIKAEENGNARQVQLIVASHSEALFNRLLRRVAEGVLTTDQIALYFCRKHQGASELEALKLNALGEIENWPEDLFGDEMADISGRAVAALQQKIRGRPNHADTSDDQSDR